MPGTAAGLDSQRQGSGSWAGTSLKAAGDHKRLSLRGNGSPFARPLRFGSPSPDGSSRIPPGATSSVPGSPRASPRSSPRGSDRGLRGMSPGKMVETYRTGMMWPHVRGNAGLISGAENATREAADDTARQESWADSVRIAPLRLPRNRTTNALEEVTALPAAEILAAHSLPKEGDGEFVISTAEANCLATLAAAEAEFEAARLYPEALPPSPEPLYRDNPWRLGLTARNKERGASRIFPCYLVTPHSVASGGRSSPSSTQTLGGRDHGASVGQSSSAMSPRASPPESARRRNLTSSTASVATAPEDSSAVFVDDYKDGQEGVLTVFSPSTSAVEGNSNNPQEAPEEVPRPLTRTCRAIRPSGVAAGYPQEKRPAPLAHKSTTGERTSTAARLAALRGRLEKNLKNAEEGLNNDLRQLDLKLAGARHEARLP